MKLRVHNEPLPKGVERVVSLFKRVMQLSGIQKVEVTPEEFIVSRLMEDEDDSPVLPKTETKIDVDLEFLMGKIRLLTQEFKPDSHPYLNLGLATKTISNERLRVCGILAPAGDIFADYFGIEEHSQPDTFLGMNVSYHENEKYPDKLLVLGGPTIYFNDATFGVIIDMGV